MTLSWPFFTKRRAAPVLNLSSQRLLIRPAVEADYAQWKEVRGRNHAFLKPYEPVWPDYCLEPDFFSRRVARLNREWLDDRIYAFLIFHRDDHRLIGGININNVTRGAAQFASLGYWLDEDMQGHGYMRESAARVLRFAFSDLRLMRMNAATLSGNRRSQLMLLKLGFREEGFAKAYLQIDGRRQDHILFGLCSRDFSGVSQA